MRVMLAAYVFLGLATSACGDPDLPGPNTSQAADSLLDAPLVAPNYVNLFLVETDPEPGVAADTGIGCGDRLVPVAVTSPRRGLAGALSSLLAQPDTAGLINVLYRADRALVLDSVVENPPRARVYLSGQPMIGGVCDHPRISGQLEATARVASAVDSFEFYMNGEPLADFLSLRD